jgi:hypothetical protein
MSSPNTTLHPMIATQLRNAQVRAGQIEAVAEHLAGLMQAVHGGKWHTHIDHNGGLVAVAQRHLPPVDKSNNGDN